MKHRNFLSQYIAEAIGTFFLIFFGCGSMILSQVYTGFDSAFIPLIWGGVVSIMIYAVGHICGAHLNPAVTIAFWSIKRFPSHKLIGYISFQIIGAVLASLTHYFIWGNGHNFGETHIHSSLGVGILIEAILSFILMFVITSVATDSRASGELAGIAIGSTVALCSFVGGPLTNASMNPARSFAPALLSGNFSGLWVYILIPIIFAILGAKTYEWIKCHPDEARNKTGCC